VALNRLADWHLKFKGDPDAARRALQVICHRLPGSHLARMAQTRINQIPSTREDLREQRTPSIVQLPVLGDTFDAEPGSPLPPTDRNAAFRTANDCVARLRQDPNNVAIREKFARLLAEQLDQADVAIDQLNLLLGMPDQPEAKRANWLSLIAAWHLKYRQNTAAGEAVLEQIILL
jgi:hypothetical protein